jgi:hypothetical protein
MKETGLLFKAEMVRALLDGSKTQTRRVVKPQPTNQLFRTISCWNDEAHAREWQCPYGQPGDRLWVRETWRQAYPKTNFSHGVVYRADKERALGMDEYSDRHRWKPSIFMPRWASRILLGITAVRVERLQDISDEDALAEGCYPTKTGIYPGAPRAAYRELWDSINGAGSWDANPWVWVVEFNRVTE